MWVPVDATGADFYDLGSRYGTQVGVLSEVHPHTGHPYVVVEGAGSFDPRCLRWHRLQRAVAGGTQDNRLAVQVVTDYEAEYEDARPGDAPFGQPEFFTAQNRTTREADTQGRVALTTSHRRVIDSEDERYALALTCRSLRLVEPDVPVVGEVEAGAGEEAPPTPPGVHFREPGSSSGGEGSVGGVTTTAPSVSVGGVTFFGAAAVAAAREALAQGGSAMDAARWASAAARGLPRPPLLDAETTTGAGADPADGGGAPAAPAPAPDPGGGVPLLNHPKGYVWSEAGRIGLLGTLVVPEGAGGSYFAGREGTPIGPLPLRHDAQVSMGPERVGRIVFVPNDAAEVPEGQGKPIKGELWADSSRANLDTELGLETLQWRPVVRVSADLPPRRPPPEPPPPPPPPPEEEEDDDEEEGEGGGRRGGRRRPPGEPELPPVGEGPGTSSGTGVIGGGVTITPLPRREESGEHFPPVRRPGSQVRDYEGPGVPCPNLTAGVFVRGGSQAGPGANPHGVPVLPVPGGHVQFFGHPGVTPVPGGIVVGGEAGRPLGGPGRVSDDPVGLPEAPGGAGVVPSPGRVPGGARVPADDPGVIPLGLPGEPGPGLGFGPPLGGGRGIPRGLGERIERARRRARRRRAREDYDRQEQERIDELEELEVRARAAGKDRLADKAERARRKIERRREKRAERARRREEYKGRIRREREERQRRREERKAERMRKREARRRRRRRERMARQDRGEQERPPQGGYWIPTADDGEAGTFGAWNAANRPLPFFGAEGGPQTLEDWAQLATYQVRALQEVVNGAFGGPGYLAGNVGVVHRNVEGSPPAGSRIGAHWAASVREPQLKLGRGLAPLEVVSVLEAPAGTEVEACAGGVLEVVREHRGGGLIRDCRPLILLENARAWDRVGVKGDLIADVDRRFFVDAGAAVTGGALRAHHMAGETGTALEVGRVDAETRRVAEHYVTVSREDGVLVAHRGLRVDGEVVARGEGLRLEHGEPELPGLAYALEPTGDGTLHVRSLHEEISVRLEVAGQLAVSGDLEVAGKLTVKGSVDPTDLQLDPQPRNPIPQASYGLWVSDGSMPGTVPGGLYFERGGIRVQLA